jgi:hypothetical protein
MLTGEYSVALMVQIELERNRLDLATKHAVAARKWAQDSLLVNIAESWVGLREVTLPLYYTIPSHYMLTLLFR